MEVINKNACTGANPKVTTRHLVSFAVAAIALALLVAAGVQISVAAEPVKGTTEQDGLVYEWVVEDSEATILSITRAPDNIDTTYEAVIPESVTADDGSTYLVTVLADNVMGTSAGNSRAGTPAVYNDELVRVVIPSMLLTIGDEAFVNCSALISLEFATDDDGFAHVESVGRYAFYQTAIEYLYLPDSLNEVGDYAFRSISGIKVLRFPATLTTWGSYAVLGSSPTEELIIPDGCVVLPDRVGAQVKSISIPDSVQGSVRVDCSTATSIRLPSSENSQITSLTLKFGTIDELVIPDSVTTLSLSGTCSNVVWPANLNIISLYDIQGQDEVEIPASVQTIESLAFARCGLKKLIFEEGSQLASIGSFAFSDCTSLTEIVFEEGIKSLGMYMFSGCSSLAEVELPASIVSLSIAPFYQCASLKKISFASGSKITRTTDSLVADCPNLREVYLPDNLASATTTTAYRLIDNCPNLEAVYTYVPSLKLTIDEFPGCGTFKVYGWGTEGAVLDFAENEGLEFVPYAELDSTGYNGQANSTATLASDGSVQVTCTFKPATGYDYERTLSEGSDYALSSVDRNGTAWWQVTGCGSACFGTTYVAAAVDLSRATMSAVGTQTYTGSACEPKPIITYGGVTLAEGTDYTLSYANNTTVGTATVTATGLGSFTGTLSASFEIKAAMNISGTDRVDNAQAALSGIGVVSSDAVGTSVSATEYSDLDSGVVADASDSDMNGTDVVDFVVATDSVNATDDPASYTTGNSGGIDNSDSTGSVYPDADSAGDSIAVNASITQAATVVAAWAYDAPGMAAASAFSTATGYPLIAVSNEGLTDDQLAQFSAWSTREVLLVGGTDACGQTVADGLSAAGITCTTVGAVAGTASGTDEACTIACALEGMTKAWGTTAVLINPQEAPLALAASAYAGASGSPLLLTKADGTLDSATLSALSSYKTVVIVGDVFQVDAAAESALPSTVSVKRIAGASICDTAFSLVEYGMQTGVYASTWCTYVVSRADASSFMTWAYVAGTQRSPLLLVDGTNNDAIVSFVSDNVSRFSGYVTLTRTAGSLSALETRLQALL